jgi:hypothetical protein
VLRDNSILGNTIFRLKCTTTCGEGTSSGIFMRDEATTNDPTYAILEQPPHTGPFCGVMIQVCTDAWEPEL